MSKKNEVCSVSAEKSNRNAVAGTVLRKAMSAEEFLNRAMIASSSSRRDDDNYRNAEISGAVAENRNFSNAEFHFSRVAHSSFASCQMDRCEFKFAELEDVEFKDCNFDCSYFNFAKFTNVRFVNCILDRAEFDFTSGGVTFENCSMKGTEFPNAEMHLHLIHCNCNHIELQACSNLGITAENCAFCRAQINGSKLSGSMTDCNMLYADFDGSDGSSCKFVDCNMYHISSDESVGIGNTHDGEIDDDLVNILDSIDEDADEDNE